MSSFIEFMSLLCLIVTEKNQISLYNGNHTPRVENNMQYTCRGKNIFNFENQK